MSEPYVEQAIRAIGTKSAVARFLGLTPAAITQWNRCPVRHVLKLEAACGGVVTRYQLRPDIYGEDPALAQEKAAEALSRPAA